MPIHNKLVRDKIPQIIELTGKKYTTRTLSKEEYTFELKKKLNEEITEYQNASSDDEVIEELADILEIMHSLTKIHGVSMEDVEEKRIKKATERGSFNDKIFLESVED
ncbi:phosphoribosyl-ATP pyrophosphohydrolase [Allobacillus sp. SKP2-8]|uniref:nucleoside triphosphate pyrophosphohydrolase n=1 Tax=unclassified Allobacillus TaxID=2628859 RepID=UPI0011834089|nr:nucleoside triphosphate pyrophosphohydrolase [Allobacillus sp. SKP2-8]TSJ65130.1 phosphoribosyl-ATP pyrophosphohydrolase [Allobacillus sp. SKP2-8]